MLNLDYPNLLKHFTEHLDPKRRSESASFLVWYLENYYRLDKNDAIDAVCDQNGDKGVDGIYVNDSNQTITIFQSKISQKSRTTIGDTALKEFAGTISQFKNADSVEKLLRSAKNTHLEGLLKLHDIANKIDSYDVIGEFIANIDIDANGNTFLNHHNNITFVGKSQLTSEYISKDRATVKAGTAKFDILGLEIAEYIAGPKAKAVVAAVKASELARLDGISDQSLFRHNVRGPLGRTGVNKDIAKSIKNKTLHKLFPLFHNGITVICKHISTAKNEITVRDYHVVNGCQSISALYHNTTSITDDLRVLVKFIQMDPASAEAAMITTFSNNQNGIRSRDSKSNAPAQIRLQNEFKKHYNDEYGFRIKRGEDFSDDLEVIENETAGLYLLAFDLKQPWGTHRKYEVFEEKHAELFGRPDVNADKILMCHLIMKEISEGIEQLENKSAARYVLTKYMILYAVRRIFDKDALCADLTQRPDKFVRTHESRERFSKCVSQIVQDIVTDLNGEIEGYGDDFDYRGSLRDQDWVVKTVGSLVATYEKLVKRRTIKPFSAEWEKASAKQKKG